MASRLDRRGQTPAVERGMVRPSSPPPSWIEGFRDEFQRAHRFGLDSLIERDDVLRELYVANMEPAAAVARLDTVDLTLGRWLARLSPGTAATYKNSLRRLAEELELPGSPTVRAMLRLARRNPQAFSRRLEQYGRTSATNSGTLRMGFVAVRNASLALFDAGLAKKRVDVSLPANRDLDLRVLSRESVDGIQRELEQLGDLFSVRTRAMLLLAADGLRTREIRLLNAEHVRATFVLVGGEKIPIAASTLAAIQGWLDCRGSVPGPLFVGFDRQLRGVDVAHKRLTARTIQRNLHEASGGAIEFRDLRRSAIVDAVQRRGWSQGERVGRFTRMHGVVRLVNGARVVER